MNMEIFNNSILEIHKKLKNKDFSAHELVSAFFEKIEREDGKINAFLSLNKDAALAQAKEVDEDIKNNNEISVLAGIPLAIKDNILVKGMKCTAGSKILENYIAPYDATVIKKLKEKKAIIIGKTNLDEFAMGSSTENSAFYTTKNPNDLERVPGGSSGGSAAAVKAGFCVAALGSDTGGSIRQPAGFCGIVGLKPTYGNVSRFGLIAFGSSLDQIGPLGKSVEDVKIIFDAIKGSDEMDSTSVLINELHAKKNNISDIKIGLPKEYFIEGIDPEVKKTIKSAIKKWENSGAKIVDINLPYTQYALACYYIIATAEASSNLARYDGIKYANKNKNSENQNLSDAYFETRGAGFGAEVKRRIILGTFVLSSGYYDAYYIKAQRIRNKIKDDFEKAFKRVDVIFTPTSPTLPFKFGEKISDPLQMYLADVFTVPVNLAGLPAISIPLKSQGLPVGGQIIGKPFEEDNLLEVSKFLML